MRIIPSTAILGEGAILVDSKPSISTILLLLVLASFTGRVSAGLPIEILGVQYSTEVRISRWITPFTHPNWTATNYTEVQNSSFAVGNSLSNPWTGLLAAEASAGLFGIHAYTPSSMGRDPYIASATANAVSEVWFSSQASGTATLTLEFSARSTWWNSSSGVLSLMNVSTGDEVWNYGWNGSSGTVGGVPVSQFLPTNNGSYPYPATLYLDGDFNSGDIYKLTMNTRTGAGFDPQSPSIDLQITDGFDFISSIPEPTTASMIGLGLLAWRSQRRNKSQVA
ncbi:MAG: hypothetical protein QM813_28365 [Verrucomicrobiota bacterium]